MSKYDTAFANWQQILPTNLPVSFTAYDTDKGQTDRVACYGIPGYALNDLLATFPKRLRIRIGIADGADYDHIPTEPYAQFFVEGVEPQNGNLMIERLGWVANPPFLSEGFVGPDSGTDEIPSEGALLFVMGWLETNYSDIANAFDGLNPKTNQVQRVRSYTFSEDESQKIFNLLENNLNNSMLYLYMGKTIAVSMHPMEFRPVIEVRINKTADDNDGGGGSHFFDFSNPCPPFC
ncbi:MAG: hypothetical protein AAFZ63_08930 [Bacteroidota bacterium]